MRLFNLSRAMLCGIAFFMFATAAIARNATPPAIKPDTVTFFSGNLQLKGLLWKPAGKGAFPAVLFNHGSEANFIKYLFDIAPAFLDQGYAFFVPFRRGQGLSQGHGYYINDELDSAEKAGGKEARTSLQKK